MKTPLRLVVLLFSAVLLGPGCTGPSRPSESPVEILRRKARTASDADLVQRWYVAELLSPKGSVRGAVEARRRLDALKVDTLRSRYARALDDQVHGRLKLAAEEYLRAAEAARLDRADPTSEIFGWAAVHAGLDLRSSDPKLWERWQDWVNRALKEPLGLGWRARGELVDWWTREAWRTAERDVQERSASEFGCVKSLRLAGPFGHGANRDVLRSFPAEAPGPWPQRWNPEPGIDAAPSIIETERHGCFVSAKEPAGPGVYYAETYLDLPRDRDLIIAVQGAFMLWVDDTLVLERAPRQWGVWPRFGARVRLGAGRHRILARLNSDRTSIRLVQPDGTAAKLAGTIDAGPPYAIVKPTVGPDPNVVDGFVHQGDVVDPNDDLLRLVVADLAEIEGQSDVANVLIEPMLRDPSKATGITLLHAARFTEHDPIFGDDQARDLTRALYDKAQKRDAGLWEARLALALWKAEHSGPKDAVATLEQLARRFPEVPGSLAALAHLYQRLGWAAEYGRTAVRAERAFPDDPDALTIAVELHDSRGEWQRADQLVERIQQIDPDREIALDRALAREDYQTALEELKRLGRRHPERKDIAERLSDVMLRAGNDVESWKKLAAALAKDPKDASTRLAMADASYCRGQKDALRRAIVDAVQAGADTDDLQQALDLVEGMTELEPFRLKAEPIISEFEASGRKLPGTAARILDYSAFWIHADASSRMLEHEIVRIQSAEAVREFSEYRPPDGLILHLRVLKKDGRSLQPEMVEGKPTVTLPHLEVGDYVETEVVVTFSGDGQHGQSYLGPTWFFREEKLSYARSELVVVSPETRPLSIETRGRVPKPTVEHRDGLVIRRWRVDESPPASSEPLRPPAREVLPNVRVGWGASLSLQLRQLIDATTVMTPVDPRLVRIAKRIAGGAPSDSLSRARRLYHFVLSNVEEGDETDGRRVIVGKRGNRWRGFIELCRSLGIPVSYAVARNRLEAEPVGPFEKAFEFSEPVLRLDVEPKPVWLTIPDKYTPFGYLPVEIRGTSAYLLDREPPTKARVSQGTISDSLDVTGSGELRADGSATLSLTESFTGKPAIVLRNILAQAPESQLRSLVESRILGRALEGAKLLSFSFEAQEDWERPLRLHAQVEVPRLAERRSGQLALTAPFAPNFRALASLARRSTPLVLSESSEQHVELKLRLPPGARVQTLQAPRNLRDGDRRVEILDHLGTQGLVLERRVRLDAARISVHDYPHFARFARNASDALSAEVIITLGSGS